MPDSFDPTELSKTLELVRSRIARYRGDTTFNEEKTKASIIEPLLKALGWDTNDPDEVDREYRPKSRDNPVDYALLLQRTDNCDSFASSWNEESNFTGTLRGTTGTDPRT